METLTHVPDCPQATALSPEPQLALSFSEEEDSDKEPADFSSEESVSASFGCHCCNSELQVFAQTAAAIPSWRCWGPESCRDTVLHPSHWHLENCFWTSLLVISSLAGYRRNCLLGVPAPLHKLFEKIHENWTRNWPWACVKPAFRFCSSSLWCGQQKPV